MTEYRFSPYEMLIKAGVKEGGHVTGGNEKIIFLHVDYNMNI